MRAGSASFILTSYQILSYVYLFRVFIFLFAASRMAWRSRSTSKVHFYWDIPGHGNRYGNWAISMERAYY